MKKNVLKFAGILMPICLGLSMALLIHLSGEKLSGVTFFNAEQDYKLKFVDSTDFLTLSQSETMILPFEILSAVEKDDAIIITTYENAVVFSPLDCVVLSNLKSNNELELKSNNVRIVITGLLSGVNAGQVVSCGEVIGTVKGTTCAVKVFLGTRKLTLDELKALI